jgi:choline dehydrogenase-like flavoprotein
MGMKPSADPTLRAVVDRMVPADKDPSGWAVGVGIFLDRILGTDLAGSAPVIDAGLRSLDAEAVASGVSDFAALEPTQQDELLQELALASTRDGWVGVGPSAFVDLVARLCAQGFYADPGNGANTNEASWRMVGYRELAPGVVWPQGEVEPASAVGIDELASRYDAVVVGAGAGGGVAAGVLAEAGMTVLLVERGRWLSSRQLGHDHLRSERSVTGYPTTTSTGRSGDPRVVDAGGQVKIVVPGDPAWSANATAVGGGTRVYGAQAWRFAPQDFRMASIYGVPAGSSLADWPIGYDDLEPWYDRAEWELGVAGGVGGDRFAGHRQRGYPMPPVEMNLGGHVLASGAARLGWLTGPVPLAVNSVPFAGRPACLRCGACVGFACPAGAKNGSHNTSLPRALATGRCDVLPEAQVERVVTDSSGRATGVALVHGGRGEIERHEVRATRIVLAAGAIETSRLLLNSPSTREPGGLGNNYDLVGRNLQSHVYAGAIGLFEDVVQDSVGPGPCVSTNDFRHGNHGIVGGGMLANDFVPTPLNTWDTLSGLDIIPRFGEASKQGMRQWFSRTQMVFGPAQEVPNPDARVQVDVSVRDRFGSPVARLSGDIHPEDRRTARLLAERAGDWLAASGAHRVVRLDADRRPAGPSGGQHQAGTCRMGWDASTSVTDPWGRLWGHENVLIADGSVHVTNGGVNPVLTIMALAYRNADHFATV